MALVAGRRVVDPCCPEQRVVEAATGKGRGVRRQVKGMDDRERGDFREYVEAWRLRLARREAERRTRV